MFHFTSFNFYLTFFPLSSLTSFALPPWPPSSASIDWLIQVKHGNGGGTNGLDELAKALQKLINNAIKDATTSLQHKSDKLSCSPNPHDPHSYCSTLDGLMKSKNEQLKNAKNISNKSLISSLEAQIQRHKSNKDDCTKSHFMDGERMSSLEGEVHHGIDVIVKLTQFSGGEDSIIELIEKEIERLTKQHKDCQKSPQSPDCAQHKKLEELKKKLSEISTNKNNSPHDLLNNLCTGLEKFLGLSNGNYTGESIVYSDLDRLCDGVMAFFYGVLHNIKPKLGQHKDTLNDALNSLKSTNNNGFTKYKAAVAEVEGWVKRYNNEVAASNSKVSQQINLLQEHVKLYNEDILETQFGDKHLVGTLKVEQAKDQIDLKVEECQKHAKTFTDNLDVNRDHNNLKESITDLNAKLKDKLESVRKTVEYESARLGEVKVQEEGELEAWIAEIKKVLEELRCNVDKKIDAQVGEFIKKLKDQVEPILDSLKKIEKSLGGYIFELEQWIVKSGILVEETIGEAREIVEEKPGTYNKMKYEEIAKNMNGWVQPLEDYINHVKSLAADVTAKITELGKKFDSSQNIEQIFGHINTKVDGIKNMPNGLELIVGESGTYKTKIVSKLTDLNSEASKLTKQFIDAQAAELEKRIERQLESMPEQIKGAHVGGLEHNLQQIQLLRSQLGVKGNPKSLTQENVADYQRQLDVNRENILSTINRANDEWQKHLHSEVQRLSGESLQFRNFSSGMHHTTTNESKSLYERVTKLAEQYGSLENLADSVGVYESLMQSFKPTKQQVDQLKRQVEEDIVKNASASNGSISLSDNIHRSAQTILPSAVSQATLLSSHLQSAIEIQKQSLNQQLYGQQLGYPAWPSQHLRAGYGYNSYSGRGTYHQFQHQLTANNPAPTLKDLFTKFDQQVKAELSRLTDNVGTKSTDRDSVYKELDAVKKNVDDLNSKLESATKQNAVSSAEPVNHAKNLDDAIDKLKDTGTVAVVEGAKDALSNLSTQINQNLTELLKAFGDKGERVKERLEKLKEYIGKNPLKIPDSLQKIHGKLTDLRNELASKPLKATEELLKFITHAERHYAGAIKDHLNTQVKQASDKLTTHARRQYVEALKFALQQFAAKVTGELRELRGMIDADLEQGHKKFMKTFHDSFLTEAQKISGVDPKQFTPDSSPLSNASKIFHEASTTFVEQLKEQKDFTEDFQKIEPSTKALHTLLEKLHESKYFNPNFFTNLEKLNESLSAFNPKAYGEGDIPPILNALRSGFTPLVDELGKQYTNVYEGAAPIKEWVTEVTEKSKLPAENASPKTKLTENGERGTKVLLTMLSILREDFEELREQCREKWNAKCIRLSDDVNGGRSSNPLGKFFQNCGYRVSKEKQDGVLRHNDKFTGSQILGLLVNGGEKPSSGSAIYDAGNDSAGALFNIYKHLGTYLQVHHLQHIDSPKIPTTVCHMLEWCSGLRYNPMYESVRGYFDKLLSELKVHQLPVAAPNDIKGKTQSHIKASEMKIELRDVCFRAEKTLIAVLGHGHEGGRYAVDFSTNPDKLMYPSNMTSLICLLLDILKRMYHQLYFMFKQCSYNSDLSGWRDCHYGQHVSGSSWQCNEKQCPKQDCDQKHNQSADQHTNCGVKSPLQSFLEDGLPGFLPHSVTSKGSSFSCSTCTRGSPGTPCKTPMGFADIITVASHTSRGERIMRVLRDLCGDSSKPLTRLCAQLNSLLPSAPKTLGDMFAFYYNFIYNWADSGREQKLDAFNKAVAKANFNNAYDNIDPGTIFGNSKHTHKQADADLYSLVCNPRNSIVCGPYLHPLNHDISSVFTNKNADKYLSWVTYITETFYNLLKALYEECNKACGNKGSKCYGNSCIKDCPAGQNASSSAHNKDCKSIVHCQSTLPTLCRYGFYFGDSGILANASDSTVTKKNCRQFCNAMEYVLKEGKAFHTLETIHLDIVSPLVAVAPVPAAHHRRPPRRPEDTLPPKITRKPPHRRTVPPRRRTRQGTRQRQVLLTIIVPSRVICASLT
ncbi:hypothetical protein, conserved [Babesia ovata]|uniref:C3H1-type domain-containing protein n=1 Tax=Babesia ovata TaxID=189622 RepID=A0A2H6KAI2_9APIC|nr:uncharacterized protein BOVATA_014950 [Babesia ovata]GBE60002.1 hypothetical protein, conserved [Babesia ovata]